MKFVAKCPGLPYRYYHDVFIHISFYKFCFCFQLLYRRNINISDSPSFVINTRHKGRNSKHFVSNLMQKKTLPDHNAGRYSYILAQHPSAQVTHLHTLKCLTSCLHTTMTLFLSENQFSLLFEEDRYFTANKRQSIM
jgi:hypothetical protein